MPSSWNLIAASKASRRVALVTFTIPSGSRGLPCTMNTVLAPLLCAKHSAKPDQVIDRQKRKAPSQGVNPGTELVGGRVSVSRINDAQEASRKQYPSRLSATTPEPPIIIGEVFKTDHGRGSRMCRGGDLTPQPTCGSPAQTGPDPLGWGRFLFLAATIKLRHYRPFTGCRLRAQGLYPALCTGTYPGFSQLCPCDPHRKCTGFSEQSSTGFPQPIHRVVNRLYASLRGQ